MTDRTPAALRMPAEWEAHQATWLTWPHNTADWPGKFAPIPWVYAEIVRRLAAAEEVRLVVPPGREAAARRALARCGADLSRVTFLGWEADRGWNRDCGPIVVHRGAERVVLGFGFDAWAKYPDFARDARIPTRAARHLGLDLVETRRFGRRVVMEGGAIDVNGRGDILATEECLLDPKVQVRNPGFGRDDYREVFRDTLGAGNVIWLGQGIAGDDTHGHVDDLCRFVAPGVIVLCREDDPADANYRPLAENRERLEGARLADGSRPEVVDLPMPAPVIFDGQRLPASYANFYIANGLVLAPTFNDPADRVALGILAELFPGRTVVGIHAVDLVWGLGTLHCLTQQEPVPPVS
jgi:agmatine deiminase